MEINYKLGDMVSNNFNTKKDIQRKMEKFLITQPIWETKTMIIDIPNLFVRRFMCNHHNCDFYIKHSDGKGKLFDVDKDKIDFVDKGCCEGGSLAIPNELADEIEANIDGIKKCMDPKCVTSIETNDWKKKSDSKHYQIKSFPKDNRCVFTIVEKDMNLCALHRYALENGRRVTELKPFECAMFPIDFVEVDDKVLLTSISETGETAGILRWGEVHCTQSCLRKTECGVPLYEFCKDSIIELLGEKKYDLIDKIYKSGKWKKLLKESR